MDGDTPFGCETPRLLVSVRNVQEAMAAVQGGADIVDVKEPARGSLGMADVDAIAAVVNEFHTSESASQPPLSAALGELHEWTTTRAVPSLPGCLDFVKLGLAECSGRDNWRIDWLDVRRRFEQAAEWPLNWVAVAYADWQTAAAPAPAEVIVAAAESNCAGVLFDTFQKSRGSLLDIMSLMELGTFREQVRDRRMLAAMAGGIRIDDLSQLADVAPNVIAIRTAACVGGRRTGTLSAERVARFRAALRQPSHAIH